MDLSYGQEYETFRSEVRGFLDQYADRQPKAGSGPRSDNFSLNMATIRERYPKNTAAMARHPTS